MLTESELSLCRQKLLDWNFDPDNVTEATSQWYRSPLRQDNIIPYGPRKTRAMILFSQLGDIAVLQYILQQYHKNHNDRATQTAPAVLHQTDEYHLFPLYMAISEPHSEENVLKVCQWLYERGANLQQTVAGEWSALSRACLKGYGKVALWLVWNGALLQKGTFGSEDPVFATTLARRDLPSQGFYNGGVMGLVYLQQTQLVHMAIFAWAKDILFVNEAFLWVLRGTILPKIESDMQDKNSLQEAVARRMTLSVSSAHSKKCVSLLLNETSWDTLAIFYESTLSPLRFLNGHPGILEKIAAFAGFTKDKDVLCTARGLVEHEKWWKVASDEACHHCTRKP